MLKWLDTVCESCGTYDTEELDGVSIGQHTGSSCEYCEGKMVRCIRGMRFKRAMGEHFNTSVGHVNNKRELQDKLKIHSEYQTAYTGMEHNYEPVDLREPSALGVTEEGLDETRKRRRDTGLDTPTSSIIVL